MAWLHTVVQMLLKGDETSWIEEHSDARVSSMHICKVVHEAAGITMHTSGLNLDVWKLLAFYLLLPFPYLLQPSPQELQQAERLGCLQTSSSVECSVISMSCKHAVQHNGVCLVA